MDHVCGQYWDGPLVVGGMANVDIAVVLGDCTHFVVVIELAGQLELTVVRMIVIVIRFVPIVADVDKLDQHRN